MRRGPTVNCPRRRHRPRSRTTALGLLAGRQQLPQVERVAAAGLPEGLGQIAVQLTGEAGGGRAGRCAHGRAAGGRCARLRPSFHRARIPSGMRAPARHGHDGGRFAGRHQLEHQSGGCLVQAVGVVDDQHQVPVAGPGQNGPPHGLQQIERSGGVIRAAVGAAAGPDGRRPRAPGARRRRRGCAGPVAVATSHWASTSSGAPAPSRRAGRGPVRSCPRRRPRPAAPRRRGGDAESAAGALRSRPIRFPVRVSPCPI